MTLAIGSALAAEKAPYELVRRGALGPCIPGARTLALDGVDGRVYLPSGSGESFLVGVAAPRKH